MSRAETADYMRRSVTWLADHLEELEADGFPKPIPYFGDYDRRAVDEYLDRSGGRNSDVNSDDEAWSGASDGKV